MDTYRYKPWIKVRAEKDGDYYHVWDNMDTYYHMPAKSFELLFVLDRGYKFDLTVKQRAVLEYLIQQEEAPTFREIMTGLGYKSPSTVKAHLDKLKAKGYISFIPATTRSIKVL